MTRAVPYLSEDAIEADAAALLTEYGMAKIFELSAPIPIEDIAEKYLKLLIEFDDTHRLFGVRRVGTGPDILGAIFFNDARIVVDEALDPHGVQAKEGRFRFTVAHETGHWRLHRKFFADHAAQASLFGELTEMSVICRSGEAAAPIEWQANFFASCLLMPAKLVLEAWGEMFPDRRTRLLRPVNATQHSFVEVPRISATSIDAMVTSVDDATLDRIARPIAERFQVSTIAMRIRLEKLGLLYRAVPDQLLLLDRSRPFF